MPLPLADALVRRRKRPLLLPPPLLRSAPWPLAQPRPDRQPGSVNLYAYCGNDPVNRHDPLGLDWVDEQYVDKSFFDSRYGYGFTTPHRWVWVDGPPASENLLLSLVKGLGEGAKHWGRQKIEEAEAIPALIEQIRANPSVILDELGVHSPSDVLELFGESATTN